MDIDYEINFPLVTTGVLERIQSLSYHACIIKKKGNLVHVAPACAGSREGSDHFGPKYSTQPFPTFL